MSSLTKKELEKLDKEMTKYFKENEVAEIIYVEDPSKFCSKFHIKLNGHYLPEELFKRLGKRLSRSNKVIVKSEGEISAFIPTLSKLNVKSVDFSGVRFKDEIDGTSNLLIDSHVGEVILPTYPENILELDMMLRLVKVDKKVDFNRALKNSKITWIQEILFECELDEVDFSEVDFSYTQKFTGTFSRVKAKRIILPKNIGKNQAGVGAMRMFARTNVEEIVNLEYFPFDKLRYGDGMFYACGLKEIEITSKFDSLQSGDDMFAGLINAILKLPITEHLPSWDNWFSDSIGCKIYIPKLKVGEVRVMRKLDDTNEIFCNRALADKLIK